MFVFKGQQRRREARKNVDRVTYQGDKSVVSVNASLELNLPLELRYRGRFTEAESGLSFGQLLALSVLILAPQGKTVLAREVC